MGTLLVNVRDYPVERCEVQKYQDSTNLSKSQCSQIPEYGLHLFGVTAVVRSGYLFKDLVNCSPAETGGLLRYRLRIENAKKTCSIDGSTISPRWPKSPGAPRFFANATCPGFFTIVEVGAKQKNYKNMMVSIVQHIWLWLIPAMFGMGWMTTGQSLFEGFIIRIVYTIWHTCLVIKGEDEFDVRRLWSISNQLGDTWRQDVQIGDDKILRFPKWKTEVSAKDLEREAWILAGSWEMCYVSCQLFEILRG